MGLDPAGQQHPPPPQLLPLHAAVHNKQTGMHDFLVAHGADLPRRVARDAEEPRAPRVVEPGPHEVDDPGPRPGDLLLAQLLEEHREVLGLHADGGRPGSQPSHR